MPPILIKAFKFQVDESLQTWVDSVHQRLVLKPLWIYVVLIMAVLCLIYILLGKFSGNFYEEIDRGPIVFDFNIPNHQLPESYLFKINKEIKRLTGFENLQNFYVIQSGSNFSVLFPNNDDNLKVDKTAIKKSIKVSLNQPALEISDRLWIPTDFKNSDPPEIVISFYDDAYDHFDQIVNMADEMSKQNTFDNVYAVPNFVSRMAGIFDVSSLSKSYASIEQIQDLQALSLLLYSKKYYGEVLEDGKSLPLYSIPKPNVGINNQWIRFNGLDLPLRYFVDYQEMERPYFFWSRNGRKRMTIRIQSIKNLDSFKEKSDYVDRWIKQSGYLGSYEIENGRLQIENTMIDLSLAVIMSIGMIFLVTWWYFNNIKESLVMILALACCTVFTLTYYLVFNSSVSIATGMGILLLMGLGINNLYLIASAIKRGVDLKLVIKSRVPSILVTNLTTVVCAIPLAFSTGVGSVLLKPIAEILVIGSVIFVVFSIFVFPGLVLMFSNQTVKNQIKVPQVRQASDQNLAA
jgi:multidrug efflux pump subunit AcrB